MILFTIFSGLIALFMGLIFSKIMFRKTQSFFLVEMVDWRKPDFVVI
jgi:Fe2+ transport system protein B